MLELKVTLEAVTPLFLGGAEARGAPELRPPAFRGAMRYWLRAALGGVIGDGNMTGLRQLESAVFGSTDYGSPITLRVQGSLQDEIAKILPHKDGKAAGQRRAFKAGQTIELTMRQLRRNDQAVWQAACAALNLALTFGGIGLRSRRGYGTLRITYSSDTTLAPLTPTSQGNWPAHVTQVASNAVSAARGLARSCQAALAALSQNPTRYPCANQAGVLRIHDLQANSAVDAVKQFMSRAPKKEALGGIGPRQSSPLWVRSIQTDGKYGLLLIVLASKFKGSDYNFVHKFLDEHFAGPDIKVKGWNV
jgi:CRISPR-associated protein Cmr1